MDVYAFVPEYADEEEVKATYVAALGFAQQSNQQLWIYVNNKHTCPFLEPVLGGPMLRKLQANQSVSVEGVAVSLHSQQTLDPYARHDVVLAVHPRDYLLDALTNLKSASSVVYVGHEMDVGDWTRSHDVIHLKPEWS
ncbi:MULTISPECIES: hypothetical protein [Pseudomonas]|uniref:hypothetical protein n=1 Tax=Pseudomonas TaxID=286 RepID=UPI0008B21067|nr:MULTISPECIES: hypothetical protein [Pseudomonas]OYT84722.1 MAG: hypothetical protein CFE50_07965 [Pseudomonas sp. PGPPP4]SEP33070.1 hypothetical protein SAMN02787149_106116 [Pseudomonas sp. Snoq117.2]